MTEYYPHKAKNKRFIRSRKTFLIPTRLNLQSHDWSKSQIVLNATLEHQPIQHGPFANYYPNGQKECQGNYIHGKKAGEFQWWYANGQKKVSGLYVENLESGNWSWWHENGIRMARGTYANGIKVNQWSTWNQNGKLLKRMIPSTVPHRNKVEKIAELPELKNINR